MSAKADVNKRVINQEISCPCRRAYKPEFGPSAFGLVISESVSRVANESDLRRPTKN